MGLHKLRLTEELQKRIILACVLAPVVLGVILLGGSIYNLLVVLVCSMMCFEWNHIIYSKPLEDKILQRWKWAGIIYVTVFGASLLYLRHLPNGSSVVLFLFLVIWSIDSAAYFAGRMVGGPKIAPKISPNKTWAGLIGGMVGAALITIAAVLIIGGKMGVVEGVFLAILWTIVAQSGDFFESWLKRQFDLKDSGQLLPGHGGLLDRLDGLVFLAPFVLLIIVIKGGSLF